MWTPHASYIVAESGQPRILQLKARHRYPFPQLTVCQDETTLSPKDPILY